MVLNTKHNFMIMPYNNDRNLTFMVSQNLVQIPVGTTHVNVKMRNS